VSVLSPPEPVSERAAPDTRTDDASFEEIYRAHYRRVYALTLRMTCNPEKAEELTQDVFVRVWQTIGTFRGESALGTWIHTVAVRTTLQHIRSETRREARVTTTDDLNPLRGRVAPRHARGGHRPGAGDREAPPGSPVGPAAARR
jgi:DNA-directed RNA polymerase specialized sigma24 family protein